MSSTRYCNPTDTGLVLNFHALPQKDIRDQLFKVLSSEFKELVDLGKVIMKV